jgi:Protein of unknown function (DUF3562)
MEFLGWLWLSVLLSIALGYVSLRSKQEVTQVADPAPSSPSPASHEATVASLAKETQTAPHVVKRLYDEEMAALQANSRVKNFVSVIAARRVKKQLNSPQGG